MWGAAELRAQRPTPGQSTLDLGFPEVALPYRPTHSLCSVQYCRGVCGTDRGYAPIRRRRGCGKSDGTTPARPPGATRCPVLTSRMLLRDARY
eukprot:141448-Rhodomonas_salina.1